MKDKRKYLRHLESTRLSSESADSWCDISAKGLMQYRTCFGDQLINWKKRGYSTVLDILTVCITKTEHFVRVRFLMIHKFYIRIFEKNIFLRQGKYTFRVEDSDGTC